MTKTYFPSFLYTIGLLIVTLNSYAGETSECKTWNEPDWSKIMIEVYPARTEDNKNISGWVDLQFSIMGDGKFSNFKVIASSPKGFFEKSTIAAFSKSRFKMHVENGKLADRHCFKTRQVFNKII